MSNHTITVIPHKIWKNSKTNQTASIYGAVPAGDNWSVVKAGFTVRINNNGSLSTGLSSLPNNATIEEATEVANRYAALSPNCVVI